MFALLAPLALASAADAMPMSASETLNLARLPDAVEVVIDGHLDETAWQELPAHDHFRTVSPTTLAPTSLPTQVRLFYTSEGLYLGATMRQDPATLVERLSSRDQGHLARDYFSFTLDTSGEGRYGFWFQLNLGDSISDGTILPEREYSRSWDGAWHGATARSEHGWTAEFFIPWSLLAMPEADGRRVIGFFASRNVAHLDERWAWPALTWSNPKFMSAFQPLSLEAVNPRQEYSVFPYASGTFDGIAGDTSSQIGADVFWRPSSDFQLTATLNPDFGNVEVDDVIVNLSAFETFYPEKRLFFQERQEVFVTSPRAGGWRRDGPLTLLHTRRIGGPPDVPDLPPDLTVSDIELGRPSELLAAVKATGQSGRLRYGALGAFEEESALHGMMPNGETTKFHQDGRDFGALRFLYEQSNGGYRALGWMSTATWHEYGAAHVHAVDGHLFTADGQWKADAQIMSSQTPAAETGYGGFIDVDWTPRHGLTHSFALDHFDAALDINDLGYLRRNDLTLYTYRMRLQRADLDWARDSFTGFSARRGYNGGNELVDASFNIWQEFRFPNLSEVEVRGGFQPTLFDDRNGYGAGSFRLDSRWEAGVEYESDSSRRFAYELGLRWREEPVGGDQLAYVGELTWRPTDRVTMQAAIDYVVRDGWLLYQGDRSFTAFETQEWLPSVNVDYFINAKHQFRMALQWVGIDASGAEFYELPRGRRALATAAESEAGDFTISELNFQLRYRWELAPMSDLFVVYTKNAQLPSAVGESFTDLFADAFSDPLAEHLVVKLRYRFGS